MAKKALSYKKRTRKMLVKLTRGLFLASDARIVMFDVSNPFDQEVPNAIENGNADEV